MRNNCNNSNKLEKSNRNAVSACYKIGDLLQNLLYPGKLLQMFVTLRVTRVFLTGISITHNP